MAGKITIGCRLPHGVVLPALSEGGKTVTLNGAYTHPSFNASNGKIAPWACGRTEVDADYWKAFKSKYAGWKPLDPKNPAVFEVKDGKDVEKVARELEGVTTGLERFNPDDMKKTGATAIDPKTHKAI